MTEPRTTVYAKRSRPRTVRSSGTRVLRVGDALGPYRLCVEIGSGGMATVYLAQASGRSGVHRYVALKCIRPELARNERFVEMFLDEARIAAQIHHANVCSVLDFDEHHGTYYLAMELLSGQTLTAIQHQLHDVPHPSSALVQAGIFARIIEAACEGLHAAHEAAGSSGASLHIVHRDVSPDNLFVTYDGNVKVMDFGVAYTSERHHTTRTGILKGKCAYLAPEVVAGEHADRRADVWGLGVVAWELVTQRKLFDQANEPAILRAIDELAITPPSQVRDGLPRLLDDVIMRALERDPARRYQTAREFGRMLNRFLVEQRQIVGLAEVADFMRSLFPEGIACARQLLKIADQLEAAPPPPRHRSSPPTAPPTIADAVVANTLARRTAPPAPEGTPRDADPISESPRPPTAEPRPPSEPPPAATTVTPTTQPDTPRALRTHPPWRRILTIALLVACAFAAGIVLALRIASSRNAAAANVTLQAEPVGVDDKGAVLLKVQLVKP